MYALLKIAHQMQPSPQQTILFYNPFLLDETTHRPAIAKNTTLKWSRNMVDELMCLKDGL